MKRVLFLFAMIAAFFCSATAAETPAVFPGGEKAQKEFIQKNVKYPSVAVEMGIEGVVTIVFKVKSDGTITDAKVKRPVDPDLEAEALRVVKMMPKWVPAQVDGKGVDSEAQVSFPFKLK